MTKEICSCARYLTLQRVKKCSARSVSPLPSNTKPTEITIISAGSDLERNEIALNIPEHEHGVYGYSNYGVDTLDLIKKYEPGVNVRISDDYYKTGVSDKKGFFMFAQDANQIQFCTRSQNGLAWELSSQILRGLQPGAQVTGILNNGIERLSVMWIVANSELYYCITGNCILKETVKNDHTADMYFKLGYSNVPSWLVLYEESTKKAHAYFFGSSQRIIPLDFMFAQYNHFAVFNAHDMGFL